MFFSKLSLGGMRLLDRDSTVEILGHAIENGISFIDLSPCYCYSSESNNCETWLGHALKVLNCKGSFSVSTKSRPIWGLTKQPDFVNADGIIHKEAFLTIIKQSLQRLQLEQLPWYQLWNISTLEDFSIATQKGGWLDGFYEAKKQGLVQHLGLTTHGSAENIISLLKTGHFEMLTLPYNLLSTERRPAIDYALLHGIEVKIMNPLCGGILTGHSSKIENEFKDLDIKSIDELALGFLISQPGISPLVGISSIQELKADLAVENQYKWSKVSYTAIESRFKKLIKHSTYYCTGCNYCAPCTKGISINKVLHFFSIVELLSDISSSKQAFYDQREWGEDHYYIEDCIGCGLCEKRCPNKLPIIKQLNAMCDLFEVSNPVLVKKRK